MRFIATLSLVFLLPLANAQEISISGKWHGKSTHLNSYSYTTIEFEQTDQSLTGTVQVTLASDSTKYVIYEVEGSIKKQKITMAGKKVIDKKGLWCLPSFTLSVIEVGDQLLMEGRWKPNILTWGGCPLGASGRISMVKDTEIKIITDATPVVSAKTKDLDAHTKDMIAGLKQREYHALIIGINNYSDESLVDLDQPIGDGEMLIKALNSYYNFKSENIVQLKNPSRSVILNQLERLSEKLDDKDNLLVFYAGHGIWDEKLEQGYWLPSDATLNSKSQWISNATIRDYIRAINTKHTLLIADACFSGGLLKERGVGKVMANLYNMPSRKAITSGTLTTVPDNSVFMKYLVKNLEQNTEPLISADQIFYQMKIAVINNSPNSQVPQYGPIHQANDEGGEFVFLRVDQ